MDGKYDREISERFVEKAKSYISLLAEHIRKEVAENAEPETETIKPVRPLRYVQRLGS
jgi:hypothetical protein